MTGMSVASLIPSTYAKSLDVSYALATLAVSIGVIADSYGLRFPFYVMNVLILIPTVFVQMFAEETLLKKGKNSEGRI